MRLLNTKTLHFQEFYDSNIPPYAILSHRWDAVEVTFQDFKSAKSFHGTKFEKIRRCCSFAAGRGHDWVWIDTCCIDKTSSAELSEAINSMYRWYENAVECYAYLKDVNNPRSESQFCINEWFDRGWTLQELLAPRQIMFLDRSWNVIGEKAELASTISGITGIRQEVLDYYHPDKSSIAMKMSWASQRKTSRVEDRAYSLMGLFGVNMPLLYGEGENAFIRLQLEILKISADESIFAWKSDSFAPGMLALRPEAFANAGNICAISNIDRPPYSMTHRV